MVTLRNRTIPPTVKVGSSNQRRRSQTTPTQSLPVAAAIGSHSPVVKKRNNRRRAGAPIAQIDEKTIWRRHTTILLYAKLFKTVAQKKYTLHGSSDMNGLKYITVNVPDEHGIERTGYLYNERDVEARALIKHGGKAGFGKKLARRFKTFVTKAIKTAQVAKIKPFYYPSSYMPDGGIPNIEIPNVGIFRLNRKGVLVPVKNVD